jgi:hypothetical protein
MLELCGHSLVHVSVSLCATQSFTSLALLTFFSLSHTVQLRSLAGSRIRQSLNYFGNSTNYQETSSLIGKQKLLVGQQCFLATKK